MSPCTRSGRRSGRTSGWSALRFDSWHEVFDALLALGSDHPVTAVIDEFPYLARANPALPSILQNAIAPRRAEREDSRSRLLLCGSAMTFMGTLLSGNAPLRGRAGLELVVPTLDYQLAAQFWNVTDPVLAIKVHAIVGGTPAYRREFARDDAPADAGDYDSWVKRTVLNPASRCFARRATCSRPSLSSATWGSTTRSWPPSPTATPPGAASRPTPAASRRPGPPAQRPDGLRAVRRQPDAFRDNRAAYEIAEPLITFYHAVMRPVWSDVAHSRSPQRLWERSQPRFTANVLGPHFERLCRHWTRFFAPEDVAGGFPPGRTRDCQRPRQ